MTISELKPGHVVELAQADGFWMFTGTHPCGITSIYIMVRLDVWPFVVFDFDKDTLVISQQQITIRRLVGIWGCDVHVQVARLPMESETLMSDREENTPFEEKLDAIRTYLQEHLYKVDPDCRYPKKGTIKLRLMSARDAGVSLCELCDRRFPEGELVLSVDYETDDGGDWSGAVCLNLKKCQALRDATANAARLEQQKIAETVVLP